MRGASRFDLRLRERSSVRAFDGPPVAPETVRRVLELAQRAPSEFNLQPWRVVVCHDAEARARLRACCLDQPQLESAGVDFVVLGSTTDLLLRAPEAAAQLAAAGRLERSTLADILQLMRDHYGDPGAARTGALRNATIFAHQLLLAGLALGLDGFWLAGVDEPRLRREFRITDDLVLAGIIGLGWGGRRGPRLPRRPLADLILPPAPRATGAR